MHGRKIKWLKLNAMYKYIVNAWKSISPAVMEKRFKKTGIPNSLAGQSTTNSLLIVMTQQWRSLENYTMKPHLVCKLMLEKETSLKNSPYSKVTSFIKNV